MTQPKSCKMLMFLNESEKCLTYVLVYLLIINSYESQSMGSIHKRKEWYLSFTMQSKKQA